MRRIAGPAADNALAVPFSRVREPSIKLPQLGVEKPPAPSRRKKTASSLRGPRSRPRRFRRSRKAVPAAVLAQHRPARPCAYGVPPDHGPKASNPRFVTISGEHCRRWMYAPLAGARRAPSAPAPVPVRAEKRRPAGGQERAAGGLLLAVRRGHEHLARSGSTARSGPTRRGLAKGNSIRGAYTAGMRIGVSPTRHGAWSGPR